MLPLFLLLSFSIYPSLPLSFFLSLCLSLSLGASGRQAGGAGSVSRFKKSQARPKGVLAELFWQFLQKKILASTGRVLQICQMWPFITPEPGPAQGRRGRG